MKQHSKSKTRNATYSAALLLAQADDATWSCAGFVLAGFHGRFTTVFKVVARD